MIDCPERRSDIAPIWHRSARSHPPPAGEPSPRCHRRDERCRLLRVSDKREHAGFEQVRRSVARRADPLHHRVPRPALKAATPYRVPCDPSHKRVSASKGMRIYQRRGREQRRDPARRGTAIAHRPQVVGQQPRVLR
jgi:hypothetical protein